MVLSRFWVFALSIVAAAAVAAALLAQGMVNRQSLADLEDGLRRDRLEVEQTLKLDARARLDAIAPLAAHPDVRSALKSATDRRSDDELRALNTSLKPRLQELNRQLLGMSADLLFAVDAGGVVVAQLGPSEARFGAGIGTFPLVDRALAGFVRDDIWVYDGAVYRMAARPVIDAGGYVGALVHGKKLDEGLATLLSRRVGGATVGFFRRDAMVGCFTPLDVAGAPTQAEVGALLATALTNSELAVGNVTPPVDVAGRGRAVFSLVTGSAADAQVGYVIARPLTLLASPMALFDQATTEDFARLPKGPLGGAAFALFVLGMTFFWLEKDRPFGRLRKRAQELGARKIERLPVADFGGGYRRIAEDVNAAIDKAIEHASEHAPRKKANLDELLGPMSGAQAPAFFGFAGGAQDADIPAAPPPARPAPGAAPARRAGPAVPPRPAGPAAAPPPPGACAAVTRRAARAADGRCARGRRAARATRAHRAAAGQPLHDRRTARGERLRRRRSRRGRDDGRAHPGIAAQRVGDGPTLGDHAGRGRGRAPLPAGLRGVCRDQAAMRRAHGGLHVREVRADAPQEPRADRRATRRKGRAVHRVHEGRQGRPEGRTRQGVRPSPVEA